MPDWPPIPEDAVEIDGRWMLPERLMYPDGHRPYVRCYLHGLIPADHRCGNSPGDHYCGTAAHPNLGEDEDHDDQATSHDDWSRYQGWERQHLRRIIRWLHPDGESDPVTSQAIRNELGDEAADLFLKVIERAPSERVGTDGIGEPR